MPPSPSHVDSNRVVLVKDSCSVQDRIVWRIWPIWDIIFWYIGLTQQKMRNTSVILLNQGLQKLLLNIKRLFGA